MSHPDLIVPDYITELDGDDRVAKPDGHRSATAQTAGLSGLGEAKRTAARQRAHDAALLAYYNRPDLHYSQKASERWDGIANDRLASKGMYPHFADCSAFYTWCIYQGVRIYGIRDFVNGCQWDYGFTGTMTNHGRRVYTARVVGDAVFYGKPAIKHVAFYVGDDFVMSNGSESGPLYLPVHYRTDYNQTRRYV